MTRDFNISPFLIGSTRRRVNLADLVGSILHTHSFVATKPKNLCLRVSTMVLVKRPHRPAVLSFTRRLHHARFKYLVKD